jgi:hypothetical protein
MRFMLRLFLFEQLDVLMPESTCHSKKMQTEALAEGPIEENRMWSIELTIQCVTM